MSVGNHWNRLLAGALAGCAMCMPVVAQSKPSQSKLTAAPAAAGESVSGYNLPPKNILDVMKAPSPPQPMVSPTHDTILLVSWQDYPSISRVATPFLRLAGVRVEPKNHSKHDTPGGYGITPCATGFDVVHVADGSQVHVALPAGRVSGPAGVGRGRKAIRVCQHRQRCGGTLDRRCQDRRSASSTGRASEPHAGRRCAMDAGPENTSGQTGARRAWAPRRRSPSCQWARAFRRPEAKRDRAAPTKTATHSTTSTTRTSSITTRPRSLLLSMPPRWRSRRWASRRITNRSILRPMGGTSLVTRIHKPYSYVTTADRFPAGSRSLGHV